MTLKNLSELLETLKKDELELFNIKNLNLTTKFKNLNETCIYSLLYIIHFLENNGYTLTHICLNDFKMHDQYLFLIKDHHIVELIKDEYTYIKGPNEKTEFIPNDIKHMNNKTMLYKSVGLFMYYILQRKIKRNLTDKDLDEIYYSKPYFFIKNTIDNNPCLIYI
jgi:hypothetical protein